jgi:outer membrane protein TolC
MNWVCTVRYFVGSRPRALIAMWVACEFVLTGSSFGQSPPPVTEVAANDTAFVVDLPTVLQLASAQSLDVQLARNAVDEARANYSSARERFLPSLVPAASYLRHTGRDQAVDGTVLDVPKHSDIAGIALTAQIPVGDAIFTTLQSRQLVAAADASATARERDTVLAAAQGYFDLVRARALIDVINDALTVSQEYERQLNEAVRIGIAFKGDYYRVQTQTQRLLLDLTRARQDQRLAAATLAQILHLDPLVELMPTEREPVPLALANLDDPAKTLVQTALDNRPELARSSALIAAAVQARRGAVYGPIIPTIGGQAFTGDFNGGRGDTTANGGTRGDYVIGLSWRIGPGGLFDWGRIRASGARLTAAELADEKLRDEIARQVLDGYTRVHSLFEQMRLARANLSAASETLRLTRERKQMGVGTVLEDIQAQQELLRSRTDYVGVVTQLNREQYGLINSVGMPARNP